MKPQVSQAIEMKATLKCKLYLKRGAYQEWFYKQLWVSGE